MNLSKDEARIITTVVSGLLPVREYAACGEQVLQTILDFLEARFDQAAAQAEVEAALRAAGLPVHFERIQLCVETASRLVGGYQVWMRGQDSSSSHDFPVWELVKSYPCAEPVNWAETWRQ